MKSNAVDTSPDIFSRLQQSALTEPLGLYLHVPFCRSRCSYCSFTSTLSNSQHRDAFVQRLLEDIKHWGESMKRPCCDTLYLGGGTPSVLEAGELEAIMAAARGHFRMDTLQEVTLEANPGTVDMVWLQQVRHMGFDRLSLGVQSLDDALLKRLGRLHDGNTGLEALSMAKRAGWRRLSADLMIGIPGQSLGRVVQDAKRLVEAGATHLSIYMLDLDKDCPLKKQVDQGHAPLPDDDEVADAFEALQETLPQLGMMPYEISNYAMPGEESLHNCRYWERRPYLGLGPGASSHMGRWRWTQTHDIDAWMTNKNPAMEECQELSAEEALAEIPLLGLRMHRGVDWEALQERAAKQGLLPLVQGWEKALRPSFEHGLLEKDGPIIRFTRKGLLLSNSVFREFMA